MTIYMSENLLRNYATNETIVKSANERIISEARGDRQNGIFLAHSHEDKDLVLYVVRFLQSQSVNTYVDWLDQNMPQDISKETACILKGKIQGYSKFMVLVTENSKNSKWVPWELGLADGHKALENIAIFPIDRDRLPFVGNEYLDIYPKIEWYNEQWLVWSLEPTGHIYSYLPAWLKK